MCGLGVFYVQFCLANVVCKTLNSSSYVNFVGFCTEASRINEEETESYRPPSDDWKYVLLYVLKT